MSQCLHAQYSTATYSSNIPDCTFFSFFEWSAFGVDSSTEVFFSGFWTVPPQFICFINNHRKNGLRIKQCVKSTFALFTPSPILIYNYSNKKAQLSLTNPRDAKACQNCSNSTSLQRCRWQYWPIFMRLTAITSEIREIPRNSLKIQTYGVQGHPRSSILVSIESPCMTSY